MQHDRGTWTAARHMDHVLWLCEASLRVTADDRLVEEIEFVRLASWQVPCRLDDPRSSRHAAFCAVRCTLRARPLAAKTRQVNRERSSLVLKILPAEGHGAHYNAIVIDRHGIGIAVTTDTLSLSVTRIALTLPVRGWYARCSICGQHNVRPSCVLCVPRRRPCQLSALATNVTAAGVDA